MAETAHPNPSAIHSALKDFYDIVYGALLAAEDAIN
jgi:hypothetical protein